MRTKDLYLQEPQHLASYDAKALKILHTSTISKRAESPFIRQLQRFFRWPSTLE